MNEVFHNTQGEPLHNQIGMKFKENTPLYSEKQMEDGSIQIKAPQVLRVIIKWIE